MSKLYVLSFGMLAAFGLVAGKLDKVKPLDGGAVSHTQAYPADDARVDIPEGVVLERQDDGHFYADVDINGTPIEMLVDTGASGVALSRDDARRAGVATSIGMNNPIGEGAGGAIYGDVVTIDRVRLGDTEASAVQAVVIDGGRMSLLGQDFLRQFDKVEIEGDRMILR
jgi:aspartyl protease family protein